MKNIKILSITETAVLLAILLVLQTTTKSFGQIFTGSCVNMVLAISAICFNLQIATMLAILSPFFAFFLGIGPAFLPLTPAIALGNIAYVLCISIICKKNINKNAHIQNIISIIIASICKLFVLYLLVVQLICKLFISNLKPQQIKTFTTMFSFPQLITALIGGIIACIIAPILMKALTNIKQNKS